MDPAVITLKADEYYVVGDNMNNSYDSRNYGPIKKSQIEKPVKVLDPRIGGFFLYKENFGFKALYLSYSSSSVASHSL